MDEEATTPTLGEKVKPHHWEIADQHIRSKEFQRPFRRRDRSAWREGQHEAFLHHVRNEPESLNERGSPFLSFRTVLAIEIGLYEDVNFEWSMPKAHYIWESQKNKLKPAKSKIPGATIAFLQDYLLLVVGKDWSYNVYQLPPRIPSIMKSIRWRVGNVPCFDESSWDRDRDRVKSDVLQIIRDLGIKVIHTLPRHPNHPLSVTGSSPEARFKKVTDGTDQGYFGRKLPIQFDADLPFVTKISSRHYVKDLLDDLAWKHATPFLIACGSGTICIVPKECLKVCWYRGWSNAGWKSWKDVLEKRKIVAAKREKMRRDKQP